MVTERSSGDSALPVDDPRLGQILDRVAARHAELSHEVTALIEREIVEYGSGGRQAEFWADVREFGDLQIRGAMLAARDGGELSAEALEVIRQVTVRRVEQQVPLESILHAFRLGHEVVWDAVVHESQQIEGGHSVAIHLTLPFMRYVDAVCTGIAEAYLNELHTATARADRAIRDLLEILLAGDLTGSRRDLALAAGEAAGASLDLEAEHQVAIFVHDDPTEPLRRLPASLTAALEGDRVVSTVRHDELLLITDPQTDDPTALGNLIREGAADALRRGVRVGIGLICGGHEGYAESAAQARSALDATGPGTPVAGLAELPMTEYLTTRPDPVAQAMVPLAVRELAAGPSAMDRAIRETLFAYVGSGMNVIRTAKSLPSHPNTVSYRLARLSERTGYDHRDPSQLIELAMALRVAMRNRQETPGRLPDRWPTSGPLDIRSWGG